MIEEIWYGIPRDKIPWYPTINYEKCITCGKCVEYCHNSTFEFEEKNGKKRTVVKNPNNCVVFCEGCDQICPVGAIRHQNEKKTRERIRRLGRKYSLLQ